MIAYLCRHLKVKTFVVTEVEDRRKVPADKLGRIFRKYTEESVLVRADRKEAFPGGVKPEGTHGGKVYCLGSLYLAGAIKEELDGRKTVC